MNAVQRIRNERANWLYQRLETLNEEADLLEQERDPANMAFALNGEIRWLKRELSIVRSN